MHSTAIDRRTFLALAASATFAPYHAQAAEEALFLGARLNGDRFEAAVIDEYGRDRLIMPLEARGHSFAIDPVQRRAVAFARSPGRFAVGFSLDGRGEPIAIAASNGRHFYGHGVFTSDGKLLLATENAYEDGEGVNGIYDATNNFRRIGEFSTGGIGPHEAILMPDGRTLCVANGGILTHPDYPRLKLNLPEMEPNLTYIDIEHGDIVETVRLTPDLNQLSIRHLVLDAQGHIWFGCQYEGEVTDRPPLVGRHRRGRALELFPGPEATLRALDNYVGSVAIDASGKVLATSSPHGGIIAFWDTETGRHLGTRQLADGCGVAPLGKASVIATSGRGAIVETGPMNQRQIMTEAREIPAWDNHLRRI